MCALRLQLQLLVTVALGLWTPTGSALAPAGLRDSHSVHAHEHTWWLHRRSNYTLYVTAQARANPWLPGQHSVLGLGNRLRIIATVLTFLKETDWNVKFVWDEDFGCRYSDLFSWPPIPDDTFPAGHRDALATYEKGCDLVSVNGKTNLHAFINKANATVYNGENVICWQSWQLYFPRWPGAAAWFYEALRLSPECVCSGPCDTMPAIHIRVQKLVDDYQAAVQWARFDWVGVHVRRTDHLTKLKTIKAMKSSNCTKEALESQDIFPLEAYIEKMEQVVQLRGDNNVIQEVAGLGKTPWDAKNPLRFYVASDEHTAFEHIKTHFPVEWVHQYPTTSIAKDSTSKASRTTKSGQQEALADLWLLSRTQLLIGTPRSSYSGTAKWLSANGFYTEVLGRQLEC